MSRRARVRVPESPRARKGASLLSEMRIGWLGSRVSTAPSTPATPPTPAPPSPPAAGGAEINPTFINPLWAGYETSRYAGVSYHSVTASWTQPAITCASTTNETSFWVGIGGTASSTDTLEQAGTSAYCPDGTPYYVAWYEAFPADSQVVTTVPVAPGNEISVTVSIAGSTMTYSIINDSTGQSASAPVAVPGGAPDVSTAEWVVESNKQSIALFGDAAFTGASATNAAGQTGPISSALWHEIVPLQIDSSDDAAGHGATTSPLSPDGSSFTVAWQR